MNHAAISYDDIVRLKHLRNVGEFVTGMAVLQDCYENLQVLNVSNWFP